MSRAPPKLQLPNMLQTAGQGLSIHPSSLPNSDFVFVCCRPLPSSCYPTTLTRFALPARCNPVLCCAVLPCPHPHPTRPHPHRKIRAALQHRPQVLCVHPVFTPHTYFPFFPLPAMSISFSSCDVMSGDDAARQHTRPIARLCPLPSANMLCAPPPPKKNPATFHTHRS